eukprot:CAMPEP_0119404270 /NCGR_PEP_ID=MMETSP1334-20130426/143809_1 /TAXON_ID=127549 /ORGANISM="Calcidiscus leptoporus, Strain RCC1130" /LENGTH=44 /DNA_ID= /DNA_START= /DNA_END= /DNA_ORIENTATION=
MTAAVVEGDAEEQLADNGAGENDARVRAALSQRQPDLPLEEDVQ